ncbi:high-affinity cell membrane calcium channel [Naematelia encephala]|uniref:Calcium-channel protein CCH1 n=1 Tax=Naematelia encephala TaxID=71784 RepID=A0A1Y2AQT6_9TREE|nr:high-affinity cell membrane calcium channel [Naematelia encephala]
MPTNHSRHSSAISTSAAVRSSSPSPAASPVSPSVEGLSRRLSWNRSRDDTLGVHDAHTRAAVGLGTLTAPSRTHLMTPSAPVDEYDLGDITPSGAATSPFFHQFQSEASLTTTDAGSNPEEGDDDDNRDREMLSPNSEATGHRRQLSRRVYDDDGVARSAGPSKLASMVSRSPTFRNVSNTLRKASVRVVNILGSDRDDGRMRLGDEYESSEDLDKKDEEDLGQPPSPKPASIPPSRPDPMPPERLRGRTLCFFTSASKIRRAMDGIMRTPLTEPVILMMIIANVVVLAIQSARGLNEPREDTGYFQSWEDVVLLVLFSIFTFEMFARIIVTGLIFDPETSVRDFLFGPRGFIPAIQKRFATAQNTLQRSSTRSGPRRAGWRTQTPPSVPHSHKRAIGVFTEAPFQAAVAKQKAISAQMRPYLRHSWHRIDMIAVIAFWITFLLAMIGQEATARHHIYIFRALSVLRAGRLLVITSGTTTILHSLKRAGPLLITVAYFLVFAGCFFSIIGVQSFRGSYRRQCVLTDPTNSSNTIQLDQQCGGYLNETSLSNARYLNINGQTSDVGAKGYICPLNQVCQTADSNPNGGSNSFDNIFVALVQIVIIASINTWSPLMYMAMDSDFFSSSLYFIVAVIVLNFWLINLLVAVVVNTFKSIRADTKKSAFGADDTVTGIDPQWTSENKRTKTGLVLKMYERTELFWVLLALTDVIAQGTRNSNSSSDNLTLLNNLELAFTLAFDLEIIIRIIAHLPDWQSFFLRGRNDFDLFLAVACSIVQIPAITNSSIYPWLTIFQLLRWYRVILAFPRMKPLLVTMFGSFAGLLNMVIFLFLMNFIGALMAVQLFRGDLPSDDSVITFSQTYNSFLAMYQIFSSENWTDILYNAMSAESQWAQAWLAAIFLCGWFLFANFVVLQMFIAVINENFQVAEEQKRKQQIEAFIRKSEPQSVHVSWIDRLNPYRLMAPRHDAVKVDTLPANLVLPLRQSIGPDVGVGVIQRPHENDAKSAMRRLLGREDPEKEFPLSRFGRPRSARIEDLNDDDRGLTDLLPPISAGPSADEHLDALRERRNQQADFIAAHPSFDRSLFLFKQSNPLRRFCQACVSPAYGERIFGRRADPTLRLIVKAVMFCTIVASIVIAAIATPNYRKSYYAEHGVHRGTWFDLVEVALGMVFVLEALIKIIADGFIFAPNAYLLSFWNILDFIILITLLVNTTTSLIFIGGLSRVTRSLKSFRALRLITLFGRLRDTLHAVLFAGALKILDASILMVLYIIPFAVWGLNIFAGLLYTCNDDNSSGIDSCIGEYSASPVDDSLSFLVPRVWANPGLDDSTSVWAFDSFRQAMLILFEIISLEGWIDVMESLMNVVGRDQQAQPNASQWNAIYALLYNLFGGVIILTLFVSIIIENFSTRSGNALLTTEQRRWVDLSKFIKAQTPSQLPKNRPETGLRAWCYERATSKNGYWATAFTGIYYIHILLLMMEDFSNNILTDVQLDWIFLFLTMLYAVDLLVRFYGLGFKSFRANGWNLFDVFVVTGSFATTIPALRATTHGVPGTDVIIQLQKLFLVSISLKLVQRISSLNQLFKTSVASLPAIGNLFLLWATLFIFFAILYMEVFGLTKMGNNAGTRFQNYYSFGNTLIMLAFMSTGEGWNGYMHDYTVQFPQCTEDTNYFQSDCGSSSWAYGLFISWNIVSMYIFVNMFTGVVVESFAYVYQMPGGASLNREEMRAFKKVWAEFDTERTGYIKRKDFVKFFSRLSGVFEIRAYPVEYSIPNLVRSSIPDPIANASGNLLVATGAKRAVDVRHVESQIAQLDLRKVRERRQLFARLYNEARISEEPGRGISFTSMLMMLAHYKLIDDENALQLDDLLVRRAKTDRVTDLVNLDRVRGLLRTIYWRRRFLASRDERRRTLNAEAEGIPAIVLEPMPATPPKDGDHDAYDHPLAHDMTTPSPPPPPPILTQDLSSSQSHSPEMRTVSLGHSPDVSFSLSRPSPSLSPSSQHYSRPSLGRQLSNSSMLSSEDAHYRRSVTASAYITTTNTRLRDSPSEQGNDTYVDSSTSIWGDMMREANEQEEE